ncbi:GNAT family N-acetyltransferase [Wenzhouxiangella marina]|uniref:Diamine acetyltransferase 2 n=1 Tax=Wenzhouxiangella marina TaxID=1579979 RepID=A0A0K0XY20_9GAMM|nr:GNAT family N-acetyltransferase [Wenzhouxiangella marina]AKS42578.1 Diamine acetyltransferase 2 [Wenzhouxiangella marina]MBB6085640.1 GNAT superfamily N-acetyltransferase [Wenzhouxiangella marina]
MTAMDWTIRPARPGDEHTLLELVRELADYERAPDQVDATPQDLHRALFADSPTAEAVLAERSGQALGFALFFTNYSTWTGRPGLYLEDLFVREVERGKGLGKALLLHLASIAHARDYGRMEWSVLDWNQPAIDFYRALGAKPMDEWTVFRLDRQALERLVGPA